MKRALVCGDQILWLSGWHLMAASAFCLCSHSAGYQKADTVCSVEPSTSFARPMAGRRPACAAYQTRSPSLHSGATNDEPARTMWSRNVQQEAPNQGAGGHEAGQRVADRGGRERDVGGRERHVARLANWRAAAPHACLASMRRQWPVGERAFLHVCLQQRRGISTGVREFGFFLTARAHRLMTSAALLFVQDCSSSCRVK